MRNMLGKVLMGMAFLAFLTFFGCGGGKELPPGFDCEKALREATEITISEKALSVGKKYDIYVDGYRVAKVSGKSVKVFGDVFELETADGKLLASEKEHKRMGFKVTRLASVYDGNDNLMGYIGEEKLTKFFSVGYTFHFYGPDKNQIGVSDQVNNILRMKQNRFYDNSGNQDYFVQKQRAFKDTYKLSIQDWESEIPLEMAIFMVCIEDAIQDAAEEEAENDDD